MNIVVGQNNSGKTALLEALRLAKCETRPYRGAALPMGSVLNPYWRFEIEFGISGTELRNMLLRNGGDAWIPLPSISAKDEFIARLFSPEDLHLKSVLIHGANLSPQAFPSHALFSRPADPHSVQVTSSQDRQSVAMNSPASTEADTLLSILDRGYPTSIYVFKPERLNIGTCAVEDTDELNIAATNLPAVLLKLQSNPARYDRFNEHVHSIFPMIHRVAIAPSGNLLNIRIWPVGIETERDDLQVKLEESGTGVGQVLSILYVAMTRTANVIAIDEPNSFLHPGASKKLMEILKLYNQNQYIISTHSPDLVSLANPSTVTRVYWNGQESLIEQLDRRKLTDMRKVLMDVGVTLSDIFGADKVVWVEGQTEEFCFPKIAAHFLAGVPQNTAFIGLRNTGDFEAKRTDAVAIWEIYERLTSGPGLLAPTLAFSFDRERRSERLIEDIKRRSRGLAHFLARATYENYLIELEAILAVLNDEFESNQIAKVTRDSVEKWLIANGAKYSGTAQWKANFDDRQWRVSCNAPALLSDLFGDLSDGKLQYHKISHSVALTEWLLEHQPEALEELANYIAELVGASLKAK
jgi:hypothetical protein